MSDSSNDGIQSEDNLNAGDSLRQALMRLTSPQVEELQQELVQLKEQIDIVGKLEGDTAELQKKLNEVSQLLREVETNRSAPGHHDRVCAAQAG
jgi:chromosome segregation ATPase